MDNKKMKDLIFEFENEISKAKKIQEMFSLLDSVAREGVDSLDDFPLAINFINELAYDNCKQLKSLFDKMHLLNKNNKTSKSGEVA